MMKYAHKNGFVIVVTTVHNTKSTLMSIAICVIARVSSGLTQRTPDLVHGAALLVVIISVALLMMRCTERAAGNANRYADMPGGRYNMANFVDEVKRLSFAIERTAASEPDNEYCRSIRVMAHELGKLAAQPGAQRMAIQPAPIEEFVRDLKKNLESDDD